MLTGETWSKKPFRTSFGAQMIENGISELVLDVNHHDTRRKRRDYPEEDFRDALKKLKTMSAEKVAKETGIPASTLRDYDKLMKETGTTPETVEIPSLGHPTLLPQDVERRFVKYLDDCHVANAALTRDLAGETLLELLRATTNHQFFGTPQGLPSQHWWEGFFRRHPQLSERLPNQLSAASLRAERPDIILGFFTRYQRARGNIRDERVFTMDEFFLKQGKKSGKRKVLALRSRSALRTMASTADSRHISCINTICGNGTALKTAVLFSGVEKFTLEELGPHCIKLGKTSRLLVVLHV
jgi:hypothetical protein